MSREELSGVVRAFAAAAIAFASGKGWLVGVDPAAQAALAGAVATLVASWSVKAKRS